METFLALLLLISSTAAAEEPPADPILQARSILDLAKQALPQIHDAPETVRDLVVKDIAEIGLRLGDIKSAEEAQILDKNYQDELWSQIAAAHAKAGDLDTADFTAFKIQNPLYKTDALIAIGAAACAGTEGKWRAEKNFAEALGNAQIFEHPSDQASRLEALVRAQTECGYTQKSLETLNEIADEKLKAVLLTEVIEAADSDAELQILEEKTTMESPALQEIASTRLAVAKARLGMDALAEENARALPPYARALAFAAMAEEYFRKDNDKLAGSMARWARSAALRIADGPAPKSFALNYVGESQAMIGLAPAPGTTFQEARREALRIEDDLPRRASLLVMIAFSQSSYAYAQEAIANLQDAKVAAIKIQNDDFERARLVTEIARVRGFSGKNKESQELFWEALRIASAVGDAAKRAFLLTKIGGAQGKIGYSEEAFASLGKARLAAAEVTEAGAREEAVTDLAMAHLDLADLKGALLLVDDAGEELQKGNVMERIAERWAVEGSADDTIAACQAQNSKVLKIRGLLGAAKGLLASAAAKEEKEKAPSHPSHEFSDTIP